MNYRGTDKAKSADFDKRLEGEPFKNNRLDSLLALYRATKARAPSSLGGGGGMEMRLICGRCGAPSHFALRF